MTSIVDLRRTFFGGGTDEEKDALEAAADDGITFADIVQATQITNDSLAIRGVRAAALGDSTTAGDVNPNAGPDYRLDANWMMRACVDSDQKMIFAVNAARSGETSTQQLARLTEITGYTPKPDFCFVMVGTNDTDRPTVKANIRAICSGLLAAGIVPVLCTTLPRNLDIARSNELVGWIRQFAIISGFPVLDFYSLVVNPSNGQWNASYSSDGI